MELDRSSSYPNRQTLLQDMQLGMAFVDCHIFSASSETEMQANCCHSYGHILQYNLARSLVKDLRSNASFQWPNVYEEINAIWGGMPGSLYLEDMMPESVTRRQFAKHSGRYRMFLAVLHWRFYSIWGSLLNTLNGSHNLQMKKVIQTHTQKFFYSTDLYHHPISETYQSTS